MENEIDTDLLFSKEKFDDDTRFNVKLFDEDLFGDDDNKGASLKSNFIIQGTNLGGGEEQDSRLIDEIVSNALVVQCDLSQIIHGTMVEGGSPATLLVFQFAFVPRSNKRRFEEAEITITFSAGSVQAITPSNTWATLQSEKERELSHSVSPGLEAAFGPGKATVGYTWQLKESKTIESHSSVVGTTHTLGQARTEAKPRVNTVFWGLYENPDTKSGIPSFIQTAVLLKREKTTNEPLGQKFNADITISGKVDNRKWAKDKWENVTKSMSGQSRKGAEVIFNPEKSKGSVQDANNLRDVKLDTYKQLVTIRTWVDGDEKSPEQNTGPRKDSVIESAGQPPSLVGANAITMPITLSATDVHTSVQNLAKDAAYGAAADVTGKEFHGSRMDATTFALPNATSADSSSRDLASKDRAMLLDDDKKQERLKYLEEQISSVRQEMMLITQLVSLVREERRIAKEIKELGG
ncbi:hypothetical protein F4805DRAFT_113710 [Annulohypoxylon moriforme]|nr:hypothetical protein F4805DRAFT_113710 [Annulohypoxylon moriforme]